GGGGGGSGRSGRWAKRASAASASTNGSAAHRRKPDPASTDTEATMRTILVALALLCLMTGTAMAQEAKVTSLMSKDLPESPGKEMLMIIVEHAPGGSNPAHRHNAHAMVYVLEGSVVMQLKGGKQVTL